MSKCSNGLRIKIVGAEFGTESVEQSEFLTYRSGVEVPEHPY